VRATGTAFVIVVIVIIVIIIIIIIITSLLLTSMCHHCALYIPLLTPTPAHRLLLSADSFLEKTLGTLSTTVDEYASEQSKFQYQQRLIARTKRAADEAAGDDGNIPFLLPRWPCVSLALLVPRLPSVAVSWQCVDLLTEH
jgi:hypothetical protein